MKIAERRELAERLREIATRLREAPASTEAAARADLEKRQARYPHASQDTHYPHQAGALDAICTIVARDLDAIIKRLDTPDTCRRLGRGGRGGGKRGST